MFLLELTFEIWLEINHLRRVSLYQNWYYQYYWLNIIQVVDKTHGLYPAYSENDTANSKASIQDIFFNKTNLVRIHYLKITRTPFQAI